MNVKMSSFPDIFTKHSCTYCLDEIIGIRVKCVECTDFDLCLQCFSSGAEIGSHKNDHSYQFVDPGAVEVFRSKNKWTAREELELLTGIEQYGFGNWENISKHIKTRTPEEAREEYTARYVEGAIGRCTWLPAYERRERLKDLGADLPPTSQSPKQTLPMDITTQEATSQGYMPNRGDLKRDPGAVEGFRSKSKWTAREELDLLTGLEQYGFGNWENISKHIKTRTPEEVREEYTARYVDGAIGRCTSLPNRERLGADLPSTPQSSELTLPMDITPHEATLLGYMPNRGDFEREYQNDAETLVSRLNLNCTYDDLDVALNLVHVDIYMDRVRERARRKKVVKDYQLIYKFFADRKDRHLRRRNSMEQEVEEKLKCVCRLEGVESHDSLVRGIQRQRELSVRLKELLRYRRAGLTHLEELPHYEQELAQSRGTGSSWAPSHQTEGQRNGESESEESTPCSLTRNSTPLTDNPGLSQETEQPPQPGCSILIPDSSQLLSSTESQLCTSLEITPVQFISIKTFFILNPEEEAESNMEKAIQNHIKSNGWYISSSI